MPSTIRTVCSFGPVQQLYEAARQVLAQPDGAAGARQARKLAAAVAELERWAEWSDQLDHVREAAEKKVGHWLLSDKCEIDIDHANLTHHNGVDGYWVGAWIWVGGPEVGEKEPGEDEMDPE